MAIIGNEYELEEKDLKLEYMTGRQSQNHFCSILLVEGFLCASAVDSLRASSYCSFSNRKNRLTQYNILAAELHDATRQSKQ